MARSQQQVGDLLADRVALGVLASAFPPYLVDRVVDQSGVREQRRRALPARLVVYYLLAMVLFFRSGYGEVWDKLIEGLTWARPFATGPPRGMKPTPAAITYARKRLGWQVMAVLLEEAAGPRPGEQSGSLRISGMRVVALDQTRLTLPDTPENARVFGYPPGDREPGAAPQAQVVALGECGTSAIISAGVSGVSSGETALVQSLLGKLAPGDLVVADSKLCPYGLLGDVIAAGAHVLWRAGPDEDLPRLGALPDGTYLTRLAVPAPVRVIPEAGEGQPAMAGSGKLVLVTDIIDARVLPAEASIAAHALRWRLDDCFSALDLLPPGRAAVLLRSKNPDLIRQEVHAMLCCYQAVRGLINHRPSSPGGPAAPGATRLT
jgi:hypothetical protein